MNRSQKNAMSPGKEVRARADGESAVNDQARALALANGELKKDLEAARKIANRFKEEVEPEPQPAEPAGRKSGRRSGRKNDKLRAARGTSTGAATDKEKAATLVRKYERTWYFAVSGWVLAAASCCKQVLAAPSQPRPDAEPHRASRSPASRRPPDPLKDAQCLAKDPHRASCILGLASSLALALAFGLASPAPAAGGGRRLAAVPESAATTPG